MAMHNPPHPGEFITEVYLEPNGISGRGLAFTLGVAAFTLSRILAADVFRLRECKIVEHWDVVAPPPKQARNPNPRF